MVALALTFQSGGCFNIVIRCIIKHNSQRGTEMPVVSISAEPHQFELKTVQGGFVKVREMSYGERIHRSSLAGAMKVLKDSKSDYAGEIAMETARLTEWDFAHLIVDHNLEFAEGQPYVFSNKAHLQKLPAAVGDEIGKYIDEINSFEDLDEGN